ncbi:amino acid permease [Kineosporia sp. NBRC 101677]|uniref:APC family permease n=1 Tax=Kineosporia sp. NBRC 101677 TaxID=3032197 RepID=UPI002556BBCC|nr:amino acid permease [Kineosporia sp. NBRC 101677]
MSTSAEHQQSSQEHAATGTPQLGLLAGTALCTGAVLGPGVMVLPALAAGAAGPASLVAWILMLLFSVPIASTFAALGARHPDSGGVATFVTRAFGPRWAVPVGWWFFAAVPVGVLSGALVGGEYLAASLGGGPAVARSIAIAILATAFATNYAGLRLSGRVQLLLVVALAVLLLLTVVVAAPAGRSAHFTPFAPHGWAAVGTAAAVLFFAFSGWEAASHLSAEFRDPRRQLPLATGLTLALVSVLYLSLAVLTIAVLGNTAATTSVPLSLLLEVAFGPAGHTIAAGAAVVLSFVAVNTYLAGGARLGAALGRDGGMPRALAKGGGVGDVPRRSLSAQLLFCLIAVLVTTVMKIELDTLMRTTSACLAAVSCAGMAAALRLLPSRTLTWYGALAGITFTAVVLLFCGVLLLIPIVLGACALLWPGSDGTGRAGR